MELAGYILTLLLGLVLGSFINVVIYRVPRHISLSKGRSQCPHCGHTLSPQDLFPVVSFLLLRGKCRYCGQKISPRYPLVELAHGLFYLLLVAVHGFTLTAAVYALASSCLIALAFIDRDFGIIPNRFPLVIFAGAVILCLFTGEVTWLDRLIGLAAVSVPLFAIAFFTGGLGEGDVKLFAALGALLGWQQTLLLLLLSAAGAAGVGMALLARGKATRKTELAFGPFIVLAALVVLLLGGPIVTGYLRLMGL